jgi:uncharacterized protein with GYD domain
MCDEEVVGMYQFLVQVAYDLDVPGVAESLQDPIEAVGPAAERLGGTIKESWLSPGEWNVVAIVELSETPSEDVFLGAFSTRGVKNVEARMLISREARLLMLKCIHELPSPTGECWGH